MIEIRWSTAEDAEPLARLHAASWRNAYAGILARPVIDRMISYRSAAFWRRTGGSGRALVLVLDGAVLGYATMGFDRRALRAGTRDTGEIFELYLAPEAQGIGLGRQLFEAARRELRAHGFRRLRVWALAENEIARRFYAGLGGHEEERAVERIGERDVEKVAFTWD
ncbi:GNAT family N-acetyltransferase [Amaricoccus solimangrovi]|uniref:GNAT family N-acetyltransferase n=1 Tax=Amaricoccus solimangrovi TaxID=2589815 RepID=A0A501WYK4_9RHOB|nr:GNAT family N-acetyltransferase [Amaricoccus solimangrovi]TPE52111.1 GNAT family N-acetyltransferase [Amaricoccus solimangrovi]